MKIVNLKLVTLLEYQNIKTFLQKVTLQICLQKLLLLKKLKILRRGHMLLMILEEIIETFYEKELQKTNQKEFRIEKVIKTKGDKLYVK